MSIDPEFPESGTVNDPVEQIDDSASNDLISIDEDTALRRVIRNFREKGVLKRFTFDVGSTLYYVGDLVRRCLASRVEGLSDEECNELIESIVRKIICFYLNVQIVARDVNPRLSLDNLFEATNNISDATVNVMFPVMTNIEFIKRRYCELQEEMKAYFREYQLYDQISRLGVSDVYQRISPFQNMAFSTDSDIFFRGIADNMDLDAVDVADLGYTSVLGEFDIEDVGEKLLTVVHSNVDGFLRKFIEGNSHYEKVRDHVNYNDFRKLFGKFVEAGFYDFILDIVSFLFASIWKESFADFETKNPQLSKEQCKEIIRVSMDQVWDGVILQILINVLDYLYYEYKVKKLSEYLGFLRESFLELKGHMVSSEEKVARIANERLCTEMITPIVRSLTGENNMTLLGIKIHPREGFEDLFQDTCVEVGSGLDEFSRHRYYNSSLRHGVGDYRIMLNSDPDSSYRSARALREEIEEEHPGVIADYAMVNVDPKYFQNYLDEYQKRFKGSPAGFIHFIVSPLIAKKVESGLRDSDNSSNYEFSDGTDFSESEEFPTYGGEVTYIFNRDEVVCALADLIEKYLDDEFDYYDVKKDGEILKLLGESPRESVTRIIRMFNWFDGGSLLMDAFKLLKRRANGNFAYSSFTEFLRYLGNQDPLMLQKEVEDRTQIIMDVIASEVSPKSIVNSYDPSPLLTDEKTRKDREPTRRCVTPVPEKKDEEVLSDRTKVVITINDSQKPYMDYKGDSMIDTVVDLPSGISDVDSQKQGFASPESGQRVECIVEEPTKQKPVYANDLIHTLDRESKTQIRLPRAKDVMTSKGVVDAKLLDDSNPSVSTPKKEAGFKSTKGILKIRKGKFQTFVQDDDLKKPQE